MSLANLTIIRRLASSALPLASHPCSSLNNYVAKMVVENDEKKLFPNLISRPLKEDDIVCYSSNKKNSDISNSPEKSSSGGDSGGKPSELILNEVKDRLIHATTGFFVRTPDYTLYRPDVVLDNRVNGKYVEGLPNYSKVIALAKMYGHVRFAFVHSQVLGAMSDLQSGTVTLRWRFAGMGAIRMGLLYVPKKLFRSQNMIDNSKVWYDAISTYHLDSEGKVFLHVLDNKDLDRYKSTGPVVEQVRNKLEKLKKLKENVQNPAPA